MVNLLFKKQFIVLWAVLLAVVSTGCACSNQEEESLPVVPPPSASEPAQFPYPNVAEPLQQARAANTDVVGWLTVPGTTINEAVVQAKNNEYYLRRDEKKGYNYAGCLFLDYRATLTPPSQNLVIYGHNLGSPMGRKDDPNGAKFAQLLKFNDETVASKSPYLYFTTPDGCQVYEIFAVYFAEAYTTPVEYHHSSYADDAFMQLVADSKARSEYHYNVTVEPGDQLLTLSTCTYKYGTYFQNANQRFVVSGRLVGEDEPFHETAALTRNPKPKPPSFVK